VKKIRMPMKSIVNTTRSIVIARDIIPDADRVRGLMFRRTLGAEQGIWMDMDCTTRLLSSIHMLFVFFPVAVFWLDRSGTVVDKTIARPFHPFYLPRRPARYVLELHASKMDSASVGEQLSLIEK
jgi:uncharacterized membrane protein (UPF0127 family)